MDIFPTLVDLAGLPSIQSCPARIDTSDLDLCTEGKSLASVVRGEEFRNWETEVALMQVSRIKKRGVISGYSIVSQQYR